MIASPLLRRFEAPGVPLLEGLLAAGYRRPVYVASHRGADPRVLSWARRHGLRVTGRGPPPGACRRGPPGAFGRRLPPCGGPPPLLALVPPPWDWVAVAGGLFFN